MHRARPVNRMADDGASTCGTIDSRHGDDAKQPTDHRARYRAARDGMHFLLGCLLSASVTAIVSFGTLAVILRLVRWACGW